MFSKQNLVSTLATTIWGLLGGFLIWGVIADPLMADHVNDGILKPKVEPIYLALGCIFQGFGFSSVYSRFGQGNYGPESGFKMGLLLAIMVGFGENLVDFATANIMNITATLINGVAYIVFFGIMGVIAGFLYRKSV